MQKLNRTYKQKIVTSACVLIAVFLFTTDTNAQTVALLKDFGSDTFNYAYGTRIFNANSQIYVYRSEANNKMHQSNGASVFVAINTGLSEYGDLAAYNDQIIISGQDAQKGFELFETKGTVATTKIIKDLNSGGNSSYPYGFFMFKNKLFFRAKTTESGIGNSLMALDSSGTVQLIDSAYDFSSSPSSPEIENLVVSGDKIIFSRANSTGFPYLMASDGTAKGTKVVESFWKEHASGSIYGINNFKEINGRVYFTTSDGSTKTGVELYYIESSTLTTKFVKDIYSGTSSSRPGELVAHNGACFFTADNGTNGRELWKTNGTTAGTVLVKDIIPGAASSYPQNLVSVGNWLLFAATNAAGKTSLYRTDGTAAGTDTLITNLTASFYESAKIGNILYFSGKDSLNGQELWQTDGTHAGTKLVSDINPGIEGSAPRTFFLKNGKVYFMAYTPAKALALYVLNPSCPLVTGISYTKTSATEFNFSADASFIGEDPTPSISYLWLFGDNTTSTDQNANHKFTQSGNFEVRLIATINGGCADTSVINVQVSSPSSGINSINGNNDEILVYPNPTLTRTYIQSPVSLNDHEIKVVSLLGQVMSKQHITYKTNSHFVDLTSFPTGFYFVVVTDKHGKQYFKKVQKI